MSLFPEVDEEEKRKKEQSLFPEVEPGTSLFPEVEQGASLFPEVEQAPDVPAPAVPPAPAPSPAGFLVKTIGQALPGPLSVVPPSPEPVPQVTPPAPAPSNATVGEFLAETIRKALPGPLSEMRLPAPEEEKAPLPPEIAEKEARRKRFIEAIKFAGSPVVQPLMETETGQRLASALGSGEVSALGGLAGAIPAAETFLKTDLGKKISSLAGSVQIPLLGGLASALPAAAAQLEKDTSLGREGHKAAVFLRKMGADLMPEDPGYPEKFASAVGNMATLMAFTGGAQAAVGASLPKVVIGNLPKAAVFTARLASWIGTSVSSVTEALMEAGGLFEDMIAKGDDPKVAAKSAFHTFWQNTLMLGLSHHFGLYSDQLKGASRVLASAPLGALEEVYQDVIRGNESGQLPDWETIRDDILIGGAIEAGGAAVQQQVEGMIGVRANGELLGEKPLSYLQTRYPGLAQAVVDRNFNLQEEQFRERLKKAVVAGEEVKLKGGTLQDADVAALSVFQKDLAPFLVASEATKTAEATQPQTGTEVAPAAQPARAAAGLKDVAASLGLKPHDLAFETFKDAFGEEGKTEAELYVEHRKAVEQALRRGEEVPEDVQNEYRDVVQNVARDRGAEAVRTMLKANKIDDQVVLDLVDSITIQENALKKAYGQGAKAEEYTAPGAFIPPSNGAKAVIQLALGSDEAIARHEGYHAIKRLLMNEGQAKILAETFGSIAKELNRDVEEVEADAFAAYRKGISSGDTFIDQIFEMIKQFFERLGNYLKTSEFKTADDIFQAIEEGKLGKPNRVAPTRAESLRYSAEKNEPVASSESLGINSPYEEGTPENPVQETPGKTPASQPTVRGGYRALQTPHLEVEFKKTGFVIIPNRKIRGPADIAFAFREMKNEAQENFFLGAIKNNRIVAIEHLGFGTIDQVVAYPYETISLIDKNDADGFFIVHNHPSGEVMPSAEDLKLTDAMRKVIERAGARFRGHVIIDDVKFGFVDPHGEVTEHAHEEYKRTKKLPVLRKYFQWHRSKSSLGPVVTNPNQVFELLKGIQMGDGEAAVYLMNVQNTVLNTVIIPKEKLSVNTLQRLATSYRAANIILAGQEFDNRSWSLLRAHLNEAGIHLLDAVAPTPTGGFSSAAQNFGEARGPYYSADESVRYSARPDIRDTPAFTTWFQNSKVVDETGKAKRVFRGDFRADLVGTRFKKGKATSGRFYFTEDPEIASNYATGKSYAESTDYNDWYKLRFGKERVSLERAWWRLTPEQRAALKNVVLTTETDDQGNFVTVEPHRVQNGEWYLEHMVREHHGDWLQVAKDKWLDSAALYDEEERFGDLLRKAGINDFDYDNPHEAKAGAFPVYLKIQNPIDAYNPPAEFVEAVEEWGRRSRYKPKQYGAGAWDKTAHNPKEWVAIFKDGIRKHENLWTTSIPDPVVEIAQELGYDGIKDEGGKYGGEKNAQWIAFEPNQIKSIWNEAPTDSADIRYKAVYHGSAASFDKFSLEKIGTGEGAAAYGWGLYMADSEDVARFYQEKIAQRGKGRVYTVDIPDEENLLDWDALIADQPKAIQEIAKKAKLDPYEATGEQLYSQLSEDLGGDREASLFLNSKGIPGLMYMDEFSRENKGWEVQVGKGNKLLKTETFATKQEADRYAATQRRKGLTIDVFEPDVTHNYVIFDDKATRILDVKYKAEKKKEIAAQSAPTFYSTVDKTIAEKMPAKAPAEQILGLLKNAPGVKQEELEWMGFEDWLKEQKGSIDKQAVLDFIKQNQVEIEDVMKGQAALSPAEEARYEELAAKVTNDGLNQDESDEYEALQELMDLPAATKFDRDTLPGGENYRELLLTLPYEKKGIGDLKEGETLMDALDREQAANPVFKSSHFSEPNILVHVRFNDRVDADGKKVLFIEEIQSDWHEQARNVRKERIKQLASKRGIPIPAKGERGTAEYQALQKEVPADYGYAHGKKTARGRVPDAPFKTAWAELALKRMLRYAAENGYDRIAWTTGEQQAERWSLQRHIGEIRYNLNTGMFQPKTPDGATIGVNTKTLMPRELENYVGKEVADKILTATPNKQGWVTLSNQDLKVGGEGMKGFYDEMIPAFLNKYTKKWGGRVGTTQIETSDPNGLQASFAVIGEDGRIISEAVHRSAAERVMAHWPGSHIEVIGKITEPLNEVHSLDITPDMKQSVLFVGQPLYKAVKRQDIDRALIPSRRPKVRIYTEQAALQRSLQRQAQAAARADKAAGDNILAIQSEVADWIHRLVPEAQQGDYLKRLAAIQDPDAALAFIDRLAKDVPKLTAKADKAEQDTLARSLQRQAAAARDAAVATRKELLGIKREIIAMIEDQLPRSAQGQFLKMVAAASSPHAVTKASMRIREAVEKYQRKVLTHQIKREYQRLEASHAIAVDYRWRIRDLFDHISFQKPRAATMLSAGRLAEYLYWAEKAGKDITAPKYLANRLALLAQRPLSDIPVPQLEDIANEMSTLAELGKTKLRVKDELDSLNKQRDIADILHASIPLNQRDIARAKPGESLSLRQSISNALARAINLAQHVDVSITPMDVVFDWLDGNQMYAGPNYRIFKSRVDGVFGLYLTAAEQMRKEVAEKAKGLTQANFERIGAYAIAQQDGGMEKLANNGLTEEDVKAIQLTPAEHAMYQYMRRKLDEMRPLIARVMKDVYNADLGQVKNYFPFITDWELMGDDAVNDRMVMQMVGLKKNAPQGYTLERTGAGKQKVNIDALDVYLKHMDDVLYLLNVGPTSKYLGELANSKAYGEAVGTLGQRIVREWIDVIARKGGSVGGQQLGGLNILRTNVGVAVLGFKLSSALVQLGALNQGSSLIGLYAQRGGLSLAQKRWRIFARDNFPEVRARIGDDVAFTEFVNNTALKKAQHYGMWTLQKLDLMAAASVAVGAYQKYMADHNLPVDLKNPNPAGLAYAQLVMRRTQSSSFFKDAPLTLTHGRLTGHRALDRLLFQFKSFGLNEWSLLRHEGWDIGIRGGKPGVATNVALWTILSAASTVGLRLTAKQIMNLLTGAPDDDDETFVAKVKKELLGKVPFISDILSYGQYGSIPAATLDTIAKFASGAYSTSTAYFSQPKNNKERAARRERITKGLIKSGAAVSRLGGVAGTAMVEDVAKKVLTKPRKKKRKAK